VVYSILSEARVSSSLAERQPADKAYSVIWDTNRDLKGWTAAINMEVVGAWGSFFYATKLTSAGGYIGPATAFTPVDSLEGNRIFFRLKYDKHPKNKNATSFGKIQWTTVADGTFNDTKSTTFSLLADGNWHLYEVNVGQNAQWVGLINNIRFYPCEDGARNDEFFISYFEIGNTNFTFDLSNPKAGTRGYVLGERIPEDQIIIQKDVNDKLLVNIDGYGFVQVVLVPQTGTLQTIMRDLSLQLGKISLGGYLRAEATVDDTTGYVKIQSGTYASDSSVAVLFGTHSCGPTLGLMNLFGTFTGTSVLGTEPDAAYTPLAAYRPTTLEIIALFDNDSSVQAFSLDPQEYILQGGRADFGLSGKPLETTQNIAYSASPTGGQTTITKSQFDFRGSTVIDINHPFSDDGVLEKVWANGIMDVAGGSKWKIFRPKLNGDILLVAEGQIGQTTISSNPNGGLVLSAEAGVFFVDVSGQNIRVRRGDLLGLYNAQLHVGMADSLKIDALYYTISGDATGTITPPPPSGAGEQGLSIYARGTDLKKTAVLDIDLRRRLNINKISITGEQVTQNVEYNIATASTASFSAAIPGSHTVCYQYPLAPLPTCFTRTNQGFNIQALNDDVLYANNGVTAFGDGGDGGIGGATVVGATYFYGNGDGEFLGVYELVTAGGEVYDYTKDTLSISCFFGSVSPRIDKPISKAVMYFKDRKNQRSWQIEYAFNGSGGDGSSSGFNKIPEESITEVKLDKTSIFAATASGTGTSNLTTLFLKNPVLLTTVADGVTGGVEPPAGVHATTVNLQEQATFIQTQWSRFEWNFTPVRATGFQWVCMEHWSTKISEFQIFSSSTSEETIGDNAQVLFSADGENFTTAELISSNTGTVEYRLGNSPQYMRIVFRPTLLLGINDVSLEFENDTVSFGPHGRLDSLSIPDAKVGSVGSSTPLLITNTTGQTSNLSVNIAPDTNSTKRLIYFNKLHSEESIQAPDFGAPGKIDFTDDKILYETSNIAINATSYGLLDLTGFNNSSLTSNLLTNPGFETGDLSGWSLSVTHSGSLSFQVPRVYSITNYDHVESFQNGSYVFGFYIDEVDPEHQNGSAWVKFDLQQTVDVSSYVSHITNGGTDCTITLPYLYLGPASPLPILTITEGATLADITTATPTTYIHTFSLIESGYVATPSISDQLVFTNKFTLHKTTKYVNIRLSVNNTGFHPTGSFPVQRQGVLVEDVSLVLSFPGTNKSWYKSWRTGAGDFTDSSFVPVTEFTTITGSTHWYQPYVQRTYPLGPAANQVQAVTHALGLNRFQEIRSFRRMTATDPGVLGVGWPGEKTIAGFRIACMGGTFVQSYPKKFQVETLIRAVDLGTTPDLNNPSHYQVVKVYSSLNYNAGPSYFTGSSIRELSIVTFLLDTPVITTGMKLVFTLNCDTYELNIGYAGNSTTMQAATGCADSPFGGGDFVSIEGLYVSMFSPLEKIGITSLPLTDEREYNQIGVTTVYSAVDLGRHYAIDTNSKVFELIAETINQSQWNATSVAYSLTNTSDPNAVSWGNTTAINTRWIRFSSPAQVEYEYGVFNTASGTVSKLPQSSLLSARIYPDITVSEFPVEGYNSSWVNLGKALTDTDSSTYIYYSDYPIIAIDIGNLELINNDVVNPGNNHALDSGSIWGSTGDKAYWVAYTETGYAYAAQAYSATVRPEQVRFSSFGAGVPLTAVRWVALRGASNLHISFTGNPPKSYNYRTPGQLLSGARFKPRELPVPTAKPTWFISSKTGLQDISTLVSTLGRTSPYVEGTDFGANNSNIGAVVNAFSGQFTLSAPVFWGAGTRDSSTGQESAALAFPHSIWRVFRDPYRGGVVTKQVAAVLILGYNSLYYPSSFKIQSLITTSSDPTAEGSWQDVPGADFTGADTWQGGLGFTYILMAPVITAGIRLYISASVYDSDAANNLSVGAIGAYSNLSYRGPQTRVGKVVVYEQVSEASLLQGQLSVNQALFATITSSGSTPDHPISNLNDERIDTYWQSPSFSDVVYITLPTPKTISSFMWELDPSIGQQSGGLSINAPEDFQLFANVGGSDRELLHQVSYSGTSFSGTLSTTTSDSFTFKINSVQGQNTDANSIQLSEISLIETLVQVDPLVTITGVLDRRPGGTNTTSTKISYASGSQVNAQVSLFGFDGGNDPDFSERDLFSLWININDVALLDTTFGSIKIGNSPDIFYRWDLKDVSLHSGWNNLQLQFSTAADKSVTPFQFGERYDPATGESKVDFITGDYLRYATGPWATTPPNLIECPGIRFIELEFRGTGGASTLEMVVDDLRFVRNKFSDICKFAPSLYLNNDEVFTIYTEGLDLVTGTVEFWLSPDWDSAGQLLGSRAVVPCLFRVIFPDNRFLSLIFRLSDRFVCIINDGVLSRQFVSVPGIYFFNRYETFHFALAWDVNGGIDGRGVTLAMYINGSLVYETYETWVGSRESGSTVLIGGEAGQFAAAPPPNETAAAYTAVPTMPLTTTQSCWALLENLKIYNYAKTDFRDRESPDVDKIQLVNPSEMLQISLDDVNFYDVGSSNLPLVVNNVVSGAPVTIYVRTNIPKGLTGRENRDASLLVRWKVPDPQC